MLKVMRCVHRVLGLILSFLFLIWFLSGIVMIYHSFPRASQSHIIKRQMPLSATISAADSLVGVVPDSVMLTGLSVEMLFDRPVAAIRTGSEEIRRYADNGEEVKEFDGESLQKTVTLWCDAPVARIDTLYDVDQWIPFGYLRDDMPILKYFFDDKERHQLYINPRSGRVLQFTDRSSRFWAWIGAIPHWVYYTSLREHQELWSEIVKWAAGLGCIMCLAGFYVAIAVWWKRRRTDGGRIFHCPYRKFWPRWHFITGMIFGIFALTFALSGLMSMTDMPDWLKKTDPNAPQSEQPERGMRHRRGQVGKMAPLGDYILDYCEIIAAGGDSVKSITWSSWGGHYPYYKVTYSCSTALIDASDSTAIRPFVLTREMIIDDIRLNHAENASFDIELLTETDDDYFGSRKRAATLPVYRVRLNDYLNTIIYYNPTTLAQQLVDDNSRRRTFLYSGLHSLRFKWLAEHPMAWNILMYTLLLGGIMLSVTSVALTLQWLARNLRKLFK